MILDRLFESRAEAVNLTHPKDPALVELFGIGEDTISGITVTESTALNFSAVYGAVKCISETLGGLDRGVYEIAENGDSELLASDGITDLINNEPNPNMTPAVFWETMQAYLLLWGNSYAEIERNRLGEPISLWPRHPQRVRVQRTMTGGLSYEVSPPNEEPGGQQTVQAADMLHVPCMGTGEVGISVISYARESIGVGMAAERFGGAFFGNGAKPGGLLKLARPATRERKKQIVEDWQREFGGPRNTSRLAVLDHDSDYTQIGIPPEDAQFLETRLFQTQEVCRWFRISPTKLMDFSHATFSNIEEINKQFASETILPWAIKWAQECRRKLIQETRRTNHIVRHDLSKLVEGDLDTLTQIFSRGRQWGWYSINDVRRKLGENTIGPDGDEYLTPQNMSPVGEGGEGVATDGDGIEAEPEKEKAELLSTVGGMTGAVEVLTAVGEGVITPESAVQMFMLFFAISEEDAKKLVKIPKKTLAKAGDKPPAPPAASNEELDPTVPTRARAEAIRSEFQSLRDEMLTLRKTQQGMRQELVAAIHSKFVRKECAELNKAAKKPNVLAHMTRYLDGLEPKLRSELETVTASAGADAAAHIEETRASLLSALECQQEELPVKLGNLGSQWSKRYV